MTSLSKARFNTALHTRIDEFLHVYLLPETAVAGAGAGNDDDDVRERVGGGSGMLGVKSTAEKAGLLMPCLGRGGGGVGGGGGGAGRGIGVGAGGGIGAGALEREKEREVDGMIQGLKSGRALGVVVVV